MALTPSQAHTGKLTKSEEVVLLGIETLIDAEIRKTKVGETVTLPVNLNKFSWHIKAKVIDQYTEAGWHVRSKQSGDMHTSWFLEPNDF